VVIILR